MSDAQPNALRLRIISAVALAIPTLGAIQAGAPYYDILIALLGGVMAWEWSRLCLGKFGFPGAILCLYVASIPILKLYGIPIFDVLIWAPGILLVLLALTYKQGKPALWFSLGALYLAIPIAAFDWLRALPEHGLEVVYWLALIVWATDIGGYFVGRKVGGPKLAPRISPKKTWAGLFGGMAGAFIVGLACANIGDWTHPLLVAVLSSGLAVVAQIGDLFESHVKRRFGQKDSSQIIPGHGGVLDRLDGMMSAAAVVAALIIASETRVLIWF